MHLKIVVIYFHEILSLVHSGLRNTWILEVKTARLGFCPFNSGNIHIEESKKPGFTFSFKLRINFKIFRVISWSIAASTLLSEYHLHNISVWSCWIIVSELFSLKYGIDSGRCVMIHCQKRKVLTKYEQSNRKRRSIQYKSWNRAKLILYKWCKLDETRCAESIFWLLLVTW